MPKQKELDGMESPTIAEIETAAEDYGKLRDKRMKLLEQEIAAKLTLITTVKEHEKELSLDAEGNRCYRFDDMLVILKRGKENVKVKHVHDGDDEDEE